MKLKHSKLRQAIVLSIVTSGAFTGAAYAQDAAQTQQATNLDNVTVTGSRIKSQTMTSSSPITEISGETFQQNGATKVEDLVNQYPQLDLSFDNFENNPSTGYATVSLRQLGAARTLTLVNGRRMPAGTSESTDLSIIPAAMVKRVDVLSGGASAVYGADAVAGVVNFVLDDEFEGASINFGYSGYQHDNDNKGAQAAEQAAGFASPNGNTGLDGLSRNFDLVVGGAFGDSGHAVGWLTYRKNDALTQDARDYSACSLSSSSGACAGSGTADPANFYVLNGDAGYYKSNGAGGFTSGRNLYNFAPENYYQRPDERYTAGFMAKYEVNEHFTPYAEAMFVDRKSSMQIAESGIFANGLVSVPCSASYASSLCDAAGLTSGDTLETYIFKRNVEGGPRITQTDTTTYRVTAGVKGDIAGSWSYDAYALYGATHSTTTGYNDFLTSKALAAATNCGDDPNYPSYDGCSFYDVWSGNIDPEVAKSLAGTSFSVIDTELKSLSAYATGNLGFGLPWANGEELSAVVGLERRITTFSTAHDEDSLEGNFAGAGSASQNVNASEGVTDYYTEVAVPLVVTGGGLFNRLDASLGYRHSEYELSGGANTYKIGLSASFLDNKLLVRGGYNRAIRAPGLNDLFYPSGVALDGTNDFCAGANPEYTVEQCERAGVPASAYGTVPANAAEQYYGLTGGNADLKPEVADTYTFGVAYEPIKNLNLAVDWYSIKIKDAIESIGFDTIQKLCMTEDLYCDLIHRNQNNGRYDLYLGSPSTSSGYIVDLAQNIGVEKREGIDFNVGYSFDLGPGRVNTSFVGTYVLKAYSQSVAADASTGYDCKGLINTECFTPKWRHIASAHYSWDRFDVGLRWRFIGSTEYKDEFTGERLTSNTYISGHGGIGDYNYFDLSGNINLGAATWTIGINNIADKEPPMVGYSGGINSGTSNAMDGYDQVGRYFFTSLSFKF